MKIVSFALIGSVLLLSSCNTDVKPEPTVEKSNSQTIHFFTADSIKIFGDLYELDKTGPTLLLFHQGGSNARGEYGPIIPKLIEEGYNVLATDQRSGGQYYGNYNRTLAQIPTNRFGDGYGYCDAYNNLEGALDYILNSGLDGPIILWGSSYSASLAIQLASKRQSDVDGVLAFSPSAGGSMKNCLPDAYFETLNKPLLILRPPSEMASDNSKRQFELAATHNHQTYVPEHGVHASSMLVAERVGNSVDDTWRVVMDFLKSIGQD